ncbi:MAG: TonB-dependent receptor plug domain-containing protein, partial [Gammaproteobacteria bacterium]|nr:TonB-dependent receptor plug domain-containing protein [Gammaproteobacteria bacterium]
MPSTTLHHLPCNPAVAIFLLPLLLLQTGNLYAQQQPLPALPLQPLSIIGTPADAAQVAGGATVLTEADLERLNYTDIQRILRMVPGVSLQIEDGYGLRPNISIRGTATDRSAGITLLEDGVLIAPAPYAAPAAYYFPNAGRINQVEVLKGPAAITQGPYTVGGALNLVSTPIPEDNRGMLELEAGSDDTFRAHAHYGGSNDNWSYLVETLQWYSDGFQNIDRSDRDAGFDIQDYMAKLRYSSDRSKAGPHHQLELKLQYSEQDSNFSYLGLTDADFRADPTRRYGLSELDNMDTEHSQVQLTYLLELNDDWGVQMTAYNNEFERNWFKTQGIDLDGSDNAEAFTAVSWSDVINALNHGLGIGDLSAADLQAIVDGTADTAAGAIQLRANDREYYSRGIQTEIHGS